LTQVVWKLRNKDFRVYIHRLVPPNDGGIALGQAYIAAARLRE
jgi:hydrogenase maturation protein HypF